MDEQELHTLGLTIKRQWQEIDNLVGRCWDEGAAIWVVFNERRHDNTAVGMNQKRM